MSKTEIKITFDEDKLEAMHYYLAKKNTSPQKELTAKLEELYGEYVPADTREYLEHKTGSSGAARPRAKRPASKAPTSIHDNNTEVKE